MEQTNAIHSVKVANITVNLHNVGYLEILDTENDVGEAVKVPCGCITSAVGTRYFIRVVRKSVRGLRAYQRCDGSVS